MSDLIERQTAIDAVKALENDSFDFNNGLIASMNVIGELPSEEPDADKGLNEWCVDCKEYDVERHCCPRYNRVIRNALKDAQPTTDELDNAYAHGYTDAEEKYRTSVQPRKGKWIATHERTLLSHPNSITYVCSGCGYKFYTIYGLPSKPNFCPDCGTDMRTDEATTQTP